MKREILKIINGKIVTPSSVLKDAVLVVENGKIVEISTQCQDIEGASVLDAQGCFVAPGCIDMHVHGGGGHDFMEATREAFLSIAQTHARYGTTTLFPTLAVSAPETFYRVFDVFDAIQGVQHDGAHMPGIHLEGNYLNVKYQGAQNPCFISLPDRKEYEAILAYTTALKRWSAAPELPGALDFGRLVSSRGIVVALAHTDADYQQVQAAYAAGFTHATHFYNAMSGVHKQREYKHEGTIEGVYLTDGMTVEVIADGIHVPPALLRMVYKFKGPENTALVTDCMAAGASDSDRCFDERVIIEDGVAKLSDRSALAGSIATADRLIRTWVQMGIPLTDVMQMAAETPARIMHLDDRKGSLQKGKDADIILFDAAIKICCTIIGGRIVYAE